MQKGRGYIGHFTLVPYPVTFMQAHAGSQITFFHVGAASLTNSIHIYKLPMLFLRRSCFETEPRYIEHYQLQPANKLSIHSIFIMLF